MKKLFSLLLALAMIVSVTAAFAAKTDIIIMVPNADHGWTGAVLTYAEEKAAQINEAGTYTAKVISSSDSANQITQLEDIVDNESAKGVVILPYDNTLEAAMRRLSMSGIPYVMFDRIIDTVAGEAVSSVKGDNEGIGAATAERFIEKGLKPGDKILIIPGDNSSVPGMRNDGFKNTLLANGWTQEQIDAIKSTAYTGWSRSTGGKLFTEWLDSCTVEEISEYKFIFTHDDEISMGILEALKTTEIDDAKKAAFLAAGVHLSSSSGLNEIYSAMRGIHQKDYTNEVSKLADMFSVTYDPAMIQIAAQDMVDYFDGKEVAKLHVVPVSVVDADNATEFKGHGAPLSK